MIDEIEWYNAPDNEWLDAVFDLPFPRAAHFSSVYQDTFYMFGGYYYGLTPTAYKAVPGSSGYVWIENGEMEEGRGYGASTISENEIFLLGGETSAGKTSKVSVYNTKTLQFGPCESLTSARSGMAAVTVHDSIVFVLGGFENKFNDPVAKVEYYYGDLTPLPTKKDNAEPKNQILIHGYPNPFNSRINFDITIPESAPYTIAIFNITGQQIAMLHEGYLAPGTHPFTWRIPPLSASGIYLLQVQSENRLQTFKMIYVK